MSDIRIGISGWRYPPWRGTFFPDGLVQKDELHYASRKVKTIEINGTFYSLQRPSSFQAWGRATPDDFVFSVKAPRFITHIRRLKDVALPIANFLASGILLLGPKLGPILWQLPPSLAYDRARMEAFLKLLPRTTTEAAAMARGHDPRMAQAGIGRVKAAALRHAVEIRHESFRNAEFIGLLRRYGVALVVADTAGKWPLIEEICADFMYARLHGDEKLYVSGYSPVALRRWAAKIRKWTALGRAVFVYFDNDVKVRAPVDAMALAHRLGLGAKPGRLRLGKNPQRTSSRQSWPATSRKAGGGAIRRGR